MSNHVKYSDEHWFDPNAAGMACLLGGLVVLGIASDMALDGTQDEWAKAIGYSGLVLLVLSFIFFLISFIWMLTYKEEEYRPLLEPWDHSGESTSRPEKEKQSTVIV